MSQRHRRDRKRALDVVKVDTQPVRVGDGQPELVAPASLHGMRGAKAGARVDHGGAADCPADGHHHRRASQRDGGSGTAVQTGVPVDRVGGAELLDRPAPSFLEDDGVKAGPGQGAGHHGAAGTGADDHHIGGDHRGALGRRDEVQRRVRAPQVVVLGAGQQFLREAVGAVGQESNHLDALDGRTDVGAEPGDAAQHLFTLGRTQPGH